MMDEFLDELKCPGGGDKGDVDRRAARSIACQVAQLLGSTVRPHQGRFAREPYFPYKLSHSADGFFQRVLISDVSYKFTATARSEMPQVDNDLIVGLKFPSPCHGRSIVMREVSQLVGERVYRPVSCDEKRLEGMLRSEHIVKLLRQVDFTHIVWCTFMPIQLWVVASLRSPESCAGQVRLFQKLVSVAYREACDRHRCPK
jgi:hypothetical protein